MDVKTVLTTAVSVAVVLHVIWMMLHPEIDQ